MNEGTAIIILRNWPKRQTVDVEVPLSITAKELVIALNSAYDLGIDTSNIRNCYLRMENPIALLYGEQTLADYGVRNGSVINIV